jgi:hypothetical protein
MLMRSDRRGRLWPVLGLAALTMGLGPCDPPPKPVPQAQGAGVTGYIPKCPEHGKPIEVMVRDPRAHGAFMQKSLTTVALAGPMTHVVEVHDCQRLVVPNKGNPADDVYGPLAMIFASESLSNPLSGEAKPQRASAVIHSWGDNKDTETGDYEPLGIKAGFNCLYLSRINNKVQARMVAVNADTNCTKPPADTGVSLQVMEQPTPPGLGATDIPPVARWEGDFSRGGRSHHIWIRCGDHACLVGRKGFKPSLEIPGPERHKLAQLMGTSPKSLRVMAINGWFDEQPLALPDGNGKLKVSKLYGVIVPHPDVGELDDIAQFVNWRPVAYAWMPIENDDYKLKLGFDQGINVISMRKGSPPEGVTTVCLEDTEAVSWWVKVESEGGAVKYLCSQRYLHDLPPDKMPGTVRWRWLDTDETTWVRCPQGCCTTN